MLWQITGSNCKVEQFNLDEIDEVLYEFDGPRIFTTKNGGQTLFWYLCAETNSCVRYLVTPTNFKIIEQLKTGIKTVFDVLNAPWIWAVDSNHSGEITSGWVLHGLDEVPNTSKPSKDATLSPDLMPLLTYRLVGGNLYEGNVPASVISRAVTKPIAALKHLLEVVNHVSSQTGRPENAARQQYDLVAKRLQYNSFEISFGAIEAQPDEEVDAEAIEKAKSSYEASGQKLTNALRWLRDEPNVSQPDDYLLEVLHQLVPPARGTVKEAELKGRLIQSDVSITLTRDDTSKVKKAIRASSSRERHLIETEGRIGELDKDKFTFILRNRIGADQDDLVFEFTLEQYDDVLDAFDEDVRVIVQGKRRGGRNIVDLVAIEQLMPKLSN